MPSEPLEVDLELARRYSRPGPRYTSYPTAPHFSEEADREAVERDFRESVRPLSLYLHVPFCESLCYYCGCHTITTRNREKADDYLADVEREIARVGTAAEGREVIQLHLGGGTPNYLTPEQIARLDRLLHGAFTIREDAEISIEMDPRRLSREHVDAFRALGGNRASFGIQDVDTQVQRTVNRIQPHELNEQAMQWLREAGFESVNIDLIYGLPHQDEQRYQHTLQTVLGLKPDRFAVFNYAHVPWMKPAQKRLAEALPDPETKLRMLKCIVETLTAEGYLYIGMDHFAHPDDELARAQAEGLLHRNFQGYSPCAGADILGLGISSISESPRAYRQNEKLVRDYQGRLEKGQWPWFRGVLLGDDDVIRREVIMRLMCDMHLDFDAMSKQLGIDFKSCFADALAGMEPFERDGLVEVAEHGLRVTATGRLFVRNLAMLFDAYLPGENTENKYSRTV